MRGLGWLSISFFSVSKKLLRLACGFVGDYDLSGLELLKSFGEVLSLFWMPRSDGLVSALLLLFGGPYWRRSSWIVKSGVWGSSEDILIISGINQKSLMNTGHQLNKFCVHLRSSAVSRYLITEFIIIPIS